jgi:hypothetical protein
METRGYTSKRSKHKRNLINIWHKEVSKRPIDMPEVEKEDESCKVPQRFKQEVITLQNSAAKPVSATIATRTLIAVSSTSYCFPIAP